MQRDLRNILQRKVALGGDYYFDMNPNMGGEEEYMEDLIAGDLIAGGKRKRKKKATAAQLRSLKKARAELRKMRRGGDFINLNDASLYQGAGRKKRAAKIRASASERGFKNPIEKAELDYIKQQKRLDWVLTEGPQYAAKLRKKAEMIENALNTTRMGNVGNQFNTLYENQLGQYSSYAPYIAAASKIGIPLRGPKLPAAADVDNAYRLGLVNARRAIRGEAALLNLPNPVVY